MHGVCSAQAAGESQRAGLQATLPFGQASANPTSRLWEFLPVFGLRLEGMTMKLGNPSLVIANVAA